MRGRSCFGILALVMLCVAVVGCNTSGCLENGSSIPLAGFYSSEDGSKIELNGIAVGGVGAPNDSLLVMPGMAVSSCYLPLRSQNTVTQYYIGYAYPQNGLDIPENNDTLTIVYKSQPYFESEECGAMYRYEVEKLSYTTHVIDSVAIVDSLITNMDVERLKIYFDTAKLTSAK